jgi:hypothetical protein
MMKLLPSPWCSRWLHRRLCRGRRRHGARGQHGQGDGRSRRSRLQDPEGVKKEQEGIYEIDDAKCKMGTMDIKLDKDFSVILISRY